MCKATETAMNKNNNNKNNNNNDDDMNDPVLVTSNETNETNETVDDDDDDDDIEREVWEFMTPQAWHNSVASEESIFRPTYQATIDTLRKTAEEGGYDVILEVGCGTGDIIGLMNEQKPLLRTSITTNLKGLIDGSSKQEQMVATTIPCIGVDINKDFIDFCQKQHPYDSCSFVVADALLLQEWWIINGYNKKYNKPLVICVNNTLNIMPNELRGGVVDQMIAVAGNDGLCMVSYWNGNFFAHAVMNYYKQNEPLCGKFDVHEHVDWDKRILVTPTNYATHWQTPLEVQQLLRSYDVDVTDIVQSNDLSKTGTSHIRCDSLAIFVWFDSSNTSNAKGYYDSNDAQTFYNKIWANEDELFHVGRYDLLTAEEKLVFPIEQQIRRAEELHELELMNKIRHHCLPSTETNFGLRVVDLGCGYGGLLRRLYKEGLVWKATGVDISHKMCKQAKERNQKVAASNTIDILEQSYLQISVGNESVDVVISMDSLLHVGPERQRSVIKEVYRMLRPGGWMIFSDIMQDESVNEKEMQPIYDRINLSNMGTVSNYKSALEENGFTNFTTDLHSDNISTHYGHVLDITQKKGHAIGLSEAYIKKAEAGLKVWKENSPGNIVWGIIAAQKTYKI